MNRRAFMVALTGSAVAKPVAYGWRCVSIDYATKTVAFEFVADCPIEESIEYRLLNGDRLHLGKRSVGMLG